MASPPTVELRPLTEDEYALYREQSVPKYAEELARARDMRVEDALRHSQETFAPTLSEVLAEGRSWIFRVHSGGEPVGWLWLFGGNSRAEALYRSLGYQVMSTQLRKTLGGQR